MSSINTTKSQYGTLPLQSSDNIDLILYFIKYVLPSNDIVIVLTCFAAELPKSLAIKTLEEILSEYKSHCETSHISGIEFKIKFNQIIKFNELEYQRNQINGLNSDLNQVKNLMNNNLEQVLERNERIGLLVNKTDRINNLSNNFRISSVKAKRKAWWENLKLWVYVIVGAILAGLIIYLLIR